MGLPMRLTNFHMTDTAFFVSSSDNTYDVFKAVSPRMVKMLPQDLYPFYVGLNNRVADSPFCTLRAGESGWSSELRNQLECLPQDISKVILILDDFWFHEKVESEDLRSLVRIFDELDCDYMRLVPVKRSFLPWTLRTLVKKFKPGVRCEKLHADEPYYSSLQLAIWKRNDLSCLLADVPNIWSFEHLVPNGSKHFAVELSLFKYSHLVEKGKWYPYAANLLSQCSSSLINNRPINKKYTDSRRLYDQLKFWIFGYSAFKIRRLMNRKQS